MKGILLDADFGFAIANGDFVVGDTTYQNKALLLTLEKGELRESVAVGVGIEKYLLGSDEQLLETEIRKQFSLDGLTIESLSVSNGVIEEVSSYE